MEQLDRLSALDASFLALDRPEAPFNVGAVAIFEAEPLRDARGVLARERILKLISAALDDVPRYRQRLEWVPLLGHPVWVDDAEFDLERHVRFTQVPTPGSQAQLWDLTGDLFTTDLDLDHPPWIFWFVEGVAGDRVAVIAMVHHCMVDGVAGVQLLERMMGARPAAPEPWSPAQQPSWRALVAGELASRARALRELVQVPRPAEVAKAVGAMGKMLAHGLSPASDAAMNPARISRERSYVGGSFPLDQIKAIKNALGGTVNDVVLTIISGALRGHLARRDVEPAALDDFRAMLPVNVRDPRDTSLGNQVALMLARLPVDEPMALRRFERVVETTAYLKTRSGEAYASRLLERIAEATSRRVVTAILALALRRRAFNVVITNIPGPQLTLDFAGARLRAFYPIVNLWPGQTVGIALFSYDGVMYWGMLADRPAVPDLYELARDVNDAFLELRDMATARSLVAAISEIGTHQ